MRAFAFAAIASLSLAACVASPSETSPGGTAGGGGKADGEETSGCPVEGADNILAAIEGGGSCYVASGLAEACAYGSSLDVQFVSAATDICDDGFAAMPSGMLTIYESLLQRCDAKYADQEGTLYRSASAFCTLEVTSLFATLFPAAETAAPSVEYSAPACPVDASDADAIDTAIAGAGYCGAAADVAESCAWGSSIDVQFASAASELCATTGLSTEDAAIRDRLYTQCQDSLAEEGGTLGQSMRAFCALQVNVVFDSLNAPVE